MILSGPERIPAKKGTVFAAWVECTRDSDACDLGNFTDGVGSNEQNTLLACAERAPPRASTGPRIAGACIGYTSSMTPHGFLRVATAVPTLRVADCAFNAERILALLARAEREGVALVVFPELCLTGYTCADLFQHVALQRGAVNALARLAREAASVFSGLAIVGLPVALDDQLFNCAALLHQGRVLGVVPKSFIPNYKEFYERRWFTPAATARSRSILLNGEPVPFGTDRLFAAADMEGLVVGVEVCEDLWVPTPPSSFQALRGATVLVNLSASNEVIGKA